MKQSKKIVSLLLVLVMILGVFTGCGKKPTGGSEDNKLTVGIPLDAKVADYDTNSLTLYLEETADVEIEWQFYASSASEYTKQLTLAAASGETLPDCIIGFYGLGHTTANEFGEDGYFMDLTKLIKDHAPNYKKALEVEGELGKLISKKSVNSKDGKIYAMPAIELKYADNLQTMAYINQEWLDTVGLKVPTNVAELEAVLEAFATKDPNGNGQADEIPMIDKRGIEYLLNAYVEYQVQRFNVDANGKVWEPSATDEYRKGVAWIASLVEKEWYSSLSFSLSNAEIRTLLNETNGIDTIGIFFGSHLSMLMHDTDGSLMKKFTALPALGDATGKGGLTIINEQKPVWSAFITTDCENPEVAMRFLDTFYIDETQTRERWGEKGVDWEYVEGKTVQGGDSYVKPINLKAWSDKSTNKTLGNIQYWMTERNYLQIVDPSQTSGLEYEGNRLQGDQWDILVAAEKSQTRIQTGNLVYTANEQTILNTLQSAYNNYTTTQIRKFASGQSDANDDAVWKKHIETLEKLGMNDLMKVTQAAYERQAK